MAGTIAGEEMFVNRDNLELVVWRLRLLICAMLPVTSNG